jgi:hypothetical protein
LKQATSATSLVPPDRATQVVSYFRPNTAASRLLSKCGDGGYMTIMQTSEAAKWRGYINSKGIAKVIYSHDHGDVVCISIIQRKYQVWDGYIAQL